MIATVFDILWQYHTGFLSGLWVTLQLCDYLGRRHRAGLRAWIHGMATPGIGGQNISYHFVFIGRRADIGVFILAALSRTSDIPSGH